MIFVIAIFMNTQIKTLEDYLDFFKNTYGLRRRKKFYYKPAIIEGANLENIFDNKELVGFCEHANTYFLNEGATFDKYLRLLGRQVKQIKGIGNAEMRTNDYFKAITKGESAYLVMNSAYDFGEVVSFLAEQYNVSIEAMTDYLLLHEHAHLSQEKFKKNIKQYLQEKGYQVNKLKKELRKALERDVENTILNYAIMRLIMTGNSKYEQIANIARERFQQVNYNYG